ncbi:MAG: lytic transglycosylase domain-containing protein [Lachnospiraceae bacterium]|nr:lytic transglycosylase domain-containing protein [Lachnospiraceae bacterium]
MIQKIDNYNSTVLISTAPPVIEPVDTEDFEVYLDTQYSNPSSTTNEVLVCSEELEAIFQKAADTYNISLDLLKAVAKAESDFNPNCTSSSGAMGIMQLMPGTAKELGVSNAYDPEENIMGGAKYLAENLEIFKGDISLSLAAYNAGRGAVEKYNGIPPYKETQNYVKKILGYLEDSNITIPDVYAEYSNTNPEQISNPKVSPKLEPVKLDYSAKKALEQLSNTGNTLLMTRLYTEHTYKE